MLDLTNEDLIITKNYYTKLYKKNKISKKTYEMVNRECDNYYRRHIMFYNYDSLYNPLQDDFFQFKIINLINKRNVSDITLETTDGIYYYNNNETNLEKFKQLNLFTETEKMFDFTQFVFDVDDCDKNSTYSIYAINPQSANKDIISLEIKMIFYQVHFKFLK